jgi:hypothetical protein
MGFFSRKEPVKKFDAKKKKENLKILIDSGRLKEAIAYVFLIYADLMKEKYDKPRLKHQTIREYAILCVNELEQKPEYVYPFVKQIEDIIYGGLEPTREQFGTTINLFSQIYNEIENKEFTLNF